MRRSEPQTGRWTGGHGPGHRHCARPVSSTWHCSSSAHWVALHGCTPAETKPKKNKKKSLKKQRKSTLETTGSLGSVWGHDPPVGIPPPQKKSRGNVSTNGAGVTTHRLGERLVSSMMDTRRSQRLRTCSLSRQEVHHWWNLGSRPTGGRNFSKIFDKTQKKYRTFSTEFRREVERKTKEAAHFLSERWTLLSDR